jgi:putative transposase
VGGWSLSNAEVGCRDSNGSGQTVRIGGRLVRWVGPTRRWILQIISRPAGSNGFVLLKWRWIVERTFGWLNLSRRLSKDFEVLPASSEAFIRLAMLSIMLQRLARQR